MLCKIRIQVFVNTITQNSNDVFKPDIGFSLKHKKDFSLTLDGSLSKLAGNIKLVNDNNQSIDVKLSHSLTNQIPSLSYTLSNFILDKDWQFQNSYVISGNNDYVKRKRVFTMKFDLKKHRYLNGNITYIYDH